MRTLHALAWCAATLAAQTHENLNAVVWMQTAAEYQAVSRQTYRAAEASLERALRDPSWTAALEQTLSQAVGLKVSIEHRSDGSGEVRIAYRNLEQLDEVARRLSD